MQGGLGLVLLVFVVCL